MGLMIGRPTKPMAIKGIIATEAKPVAWSMFNNIVAMATDMHFELQV